MEKKRKVDKREQEELDRVQRSNTRQLEKELQDKGAELCETKAAKEEQDRAVKRGEERLYGLREYGDGWRRKYADKYRRTNRRWKKRLESCRLRLKIE